MAMKATTTLKVMNQEFVKLDRLDGSNFNCWNEKMLFLLNFLNMTYVLDLNLQLVEDLTPNASPEEIAKVAKLKKNHEEDNFTYQGHILNNLSDQLYDLYMSIIVTSRSYHLEVALILEQYRKKLLHMAEDFTVEKILRHFCIEEETQKRDAMYLS
ncbi:hypothetical protein J1N35_008328 [Gossypium stocksii]|uniref:Uncharacterized protein n=1 Tax=Gossypium stocksii TaxID=47602 RepID=A0A9D3WA48_9ROSI|nr:hypothetical protein J1N35_008328 [Gossypium stocksii]